MNLEEPNDRETHVCVITGFSLNIKIYKFELTLLLLSTSLFICSWLLLNGYSKIKTMLNLFTRTNSLFLLNGALFHLARIVQTMGTNVAGRLFVSEASLCVKSSH